ncbi:MAG: hypothetical protein ACKV2T_27140 [Kofleriaceae bacterium]
MRDDLMIVTNIDRIHIFDGSAWTQFTLQPDDSVPRVEPRPDSQPRASLQ